MFIVHLFPFLAHYALHEGFKQQLVVVNSKAIQHIAQWTTIRKNSEKFWESLPISSVEIGKNKYFLIFVIFKLELIQSTYIKTVG